jgi:hypothetical protein
MKPKNNGSFIVHSDLFFSKLLKLLMLVLSDPYKMMQWEYSVWNASQVQCIVSQLFVFSSSTMSNT